MLGFRTVLGVVSGATLIATSFGCGGSVSQGEGGAASGGAASGGVAGELNVSGGASAGSPVGPGRAGAGAGGKGGAPMGGATTTDPEPIQMDCPMEDLPPPDMQCDPFVKGDCGPDAGCYPFVEHPEGSGCGEQHYGTMCSTAGLGTQGDNCGGEVGDWCAPGFVCVVGQRAGKRCAALCRLDGTRQCSGGLLCGDLDVAGFGVCG